MTERSDTKVVRVSNEAVKAIETIARLRGIDHLPQKEKVENVLRHAIGTEQFLTEKVAAGARVTIESRRYWWWPWKKEVHELFLR